MLHGGNGICTVIILPDSHAAKEALTKVRQFQPPDTVFHHPVRQLSDHYRIWFRLCNNCHRNGFPATPDKVQQCTATRGQFNGTIQPYTAGNGVRRQYAPADHGSGVIIVGDFNDVAGSVAQPFCAN